MKVGRNDPCPCGSGKKYKKCCMEKDELELIAKGEISTEEEDIDEWEKEDRDDFLSIWHTDLEKEEEWDDVLDDYDESDEDTDELDDEDVADFDELDEEEDDEDDDDEDELLEISEEENELINDWWAAFAEMDDTVQEREHLVAFMEQYPHLVDYLDVGDEVLTELGRAHFEKGIYETFVELLLRIRKEYPYTYRESRGSNDFNLICWYIAQGRLDEITPFFDGFKQDQTFESDNKLEETVKVLQATNHSGILPVLLKDSISREFITRTLINNTVSRYLGKPVTDESIRELMDELVSEGVQPEYMGEANDWKEKMLRYTRPFSQWLDDLPGKRSQALVYYRAITDNFARFLYEKTEMSFDSAEYYANSMYRFYKFATLPRKRPKNVFCMDKEMIDNNLLMSVLDLFESPVARLSQLNALYYYADYLETCGNITELQRRELQEYFTEDYWDHYSEVKNSGPEMLLFKQFPLSLKPIQL